MSVLSRIIPPPNYMTMPSLGVDISDTSLKYIEFEPRSGKNKKISNWGEIDIPGGVLSRGQIKDVKQLSAVLKELKGEVDSEYVNVSLPEEKAYLFETEIRRNIPLKEIRGLLEFKLEENVPIPSRDVIFDYTIMPGIDKRKLQVAVVAYPKETIQQYYDACVEAGLHPLSFEIEAQAMARSVVPKDVSGSVLMFDFGKTRSGIGIINQGMLFYASTIEVGGNLLSEALRKVLGSDTFESDLTDIKNTQGLVRGADSTDVYDALIGAVSVIKDELASRMQYWHLRNGNSEERRIGSVILCGGSSNLKGFPSYLTESLGIPCIRGNVWENTFSLDDTVPPIDRRYSYGYASAIGLALKTAIDI